MSTLTELDDPKYVKIWQYIELLKNQNKNGEILRNEERMTIKRAI